MNKNLIIINILVFSLVGIFYIAYLMTAPISYAFTDSEMEQFRAKDTSLVITPLLTANAYENGFYRYHAGICDTECLTVKINQTVPYSHTSSKNAMTVLKKMNYEMISDYAASVNPQTINSYKTVILLHNEYMTRDLFDAIQNHPNVIYLYPNALYAEVKIHDDTMVLVRGHGYPDKAIKNGFGWKYDNSELEYKNACGGIEWLRVSNGWQLNCYPENSFYEYKEILLFIKEKS